MSKFTRILSIDGGGIRGLIPAKVLAAVEQKLQEKTGNKNARIADFFDLISGTSTGGLLTCIYLCPGLNGSRDRPRFSAEEAVRLYMERGDRIFDLSLWQRIRSAGGLRDEKYSADAFEEMLEDYFGDLRLSDLLKPCLITAYDIKRRCTVFFTQHDAKRMETRDFFLKDVARATSAAPTYFEAAKIKSLADVPYPLIDGGVFANNPAICAYIEVRRKFKKRPGIKKIAMLSLGTGFIKKPYSYESVKNWGAVEWSKPLMDIMMSGVSETVDYQLYQLFDVAGKPDQYLRINSELIFANPDMDDASGENLHALEQEGTRIVAEFNDSLDRFLRLLI
ncbi:MAG: patatin-like phospholipase family protein [Spirochaetes bacterium]|nr:patatin-like phospholipase family protein [Spirochaetota bacterium]